MAKKIKRLYRSKDDAVIGGVIGGIGEYFEVDSTLLRLLTVFTTFFTGFFPGIITYLVAWIIIPMKK